MAERIGKRQRDLLSKLGGISFAVVVGDSISQSLVRRGILAADDDGSFAHITAYGLRVLAEEIDAGRVALFDKSRLARRGDG